MSLSSDRSSSHVASSVSVCVVLLVLLLFFIVVFILRKRRVQRKITTGMAANQRQLWLHSRSLIRRPD